ncbi:GHMP family kinase ATP-binding protein [Streptomyces hydrogenans]|uniref:GHMP family kinase ATP-binding protein n=1 Tax=Streptomyces hydrogenans TaxID=1873719 RepID=UPI0035D5D0A0
MTTGTSHLHPDPHPHPASHPRPALSSGTGPAPSPGIGHAPSHHGELLQGVFLDADGRPRAGLVTLPVDAPGTRADFTPRPGTPPDAVVVVPGGRTKAARAARFAVALCAERTGRPACGGTLRLAGGVPLGLGMGSSTSDVLASVRAVADAYGLRLDAATTARLAVRAERASDPLMLDARPVLFAQREGRVLEVLGAALPPLLVVGCLLGGGAAVDTLGLPAPATTGAELRAYARLREQLRRAVADGDAALLGRVATASARRAQRVLKHPEFEELVVLARRTGAVGVQISHSGSVAGVLHDPAVPGAEARADATRHALDASRIPYTRTFTVGDNLNSPRITPSPGGGYFWTAKGCSLH